VAVDQQAPAATLRVRLLGGVDLRHGEAARPPLDSARAESLLAYLLLHRDALAGYVEVLDGRVPAGMARIQRSLDDPAEGEHAPGLHASMRRLLLAACAAAGDARAGLAAAHRALEAGEPVRTRESEARRLRGEFLAALGAPGEEVEAELRQALQVAGRQGAGCWSCGRPPASSATTSTPAAARRPRRGTCWRRSWSGSPTRPGRARPARPAPCSPAAERRGAAVGGLHGLPAGQPAADPVPADQRQRHGLTVDNLLAVELVTAEGERLRVDAESEPELFWGLRGGGGNFGIATAFEYRLHPVEPMVLGGPILFPLDDARRVLRTVRDLAPDAPDELGVTVTMMPAPPLPFLPPPVRGKPVVGVVAVWSGEVAAGERAIAPLREAGTPIAELVAGPGRSCTGNYWLTPSHS
jgi:hypothetical protein